MGGIRNASEITHAASLYLQWGHAMYSYDAVLAIANALRSLRKAGTKVSGTPLINAIRNENFTGATGRILFDTTTGMRTTGNVILLNTGSSISTFPSAFLPAIYDVNSPFINLSSETFVPGFKLVNNGLNSSVVANTTNRSGLYKGNRIPLKVNVIGQYSLGSVYEESAIHTSVPNVELFGRCDTTSCFIDWPGCTNSKGCMLPHHAPPRSGINELLWLIPTVAAVAILIVIVGVLLLRRRLYHRLFRRSDAWRALPEDVVFEEKVGQGSYGAVFRGRWRGEVVAIKKLSFKTITIDVLKDFISEVSIMSDLRHPNVVLFMAAILDGEPAIITEFMP